MTISSKAGGVNIVYAQEVRSVIKKLSTGHFQKRAPFYYHTRKNIKLNSILNSYS